MLTPNVQGLHYVRLCCKRMNKKDKKRMEWWVIAGTPSHDCMVVYDMMHEEFGNQTKQENDW